MEYILIFFALIIGFLTAWFAASRKQNHLRSEYDQNEKNLISIQSEIENQKSVALETVRLKSEELQRIQLEFSRQLEIANSRGIEIATLKTINENRQKI